MKDEWTWRSRRRGIKGTAQEHTEVLLSFLWGFNLSCAPEKGRELVLYPQRFSGTILICCFIISSWGNVLKVKLNVMRIIA